jgi:hypothetical protein
MAETTRSRWAHYASGLSHEQIEEQYRGANQLNEKLGKESRILEPFTRDTAFEIRSGKSGLA